MVGVEYRKQIQDKLHWLIPLIFHFKNYSQVLCFVSSHDPPDLASQAELAWDMLCGIPKRALNIIRGGNFGGADLIKLDSEISRPSFRDSWLDL